MSPRLSTCVNALSDLSNERAAFTVSHVAQLGYELLLLAVLSSRHQALVVRRVRIPVDVHQKGWRHEVWGLLRLLVQHVVVGVAD